MDVQADMGFCCPNMPDNTFSHGMVHFHVLFISIGGISILPMGKLTGSQNFGRASCLADFLQLIEYQLSMQYVLLDPSNHTVDL